MNSIYDLKELNGIVSEGTPQEGDREKEVESLRKGLNQLTTSVLEEAAILLELAIVAEDAPIASQILRQVEETCGTAAMLQVAKRADLGMFETIVLYHFC